MAYTGTGFCSDTEEGHGNVGQGIRCLAKIRTAPVRIEVQNITDKRTYSIVLVIMCSDFVRP